MTHAALPTRYHPRVEAGFMVKLHMNGRSMLAKADDLSMAGLRLLGEFSPKVDALKVSIPVPGDREITTEATIKRHDLDAMAIEFKQLDWDDMFALARFLHPRLP